MTPAINCERAPMSEDRLAPLGPDMCLRQAEKCRQIAERTHAVSTRNALLRLASEFEAKASERRLGAFRGRA